MADYWDDMEAAFLDVEIDDRRFVMLLEDAAYHAVKEFVRA